MKAEGLIRSTDEALSWGVCVEVYSTLRKDYRWREGERERGGGERKKEREREEEKQRKRLKLDEKL